VWTQLIGAGAFDIQSTFLDVGGQPLQVFEAVAKIADRTGVRLGPRVFATSTLAEIASKIEAARPGNEQGKTRKPGSDRQSYGAILREAVATRTTAYKLRRCALVGPGARADGRVWIHGEGRVVIGKGVLLDGTRTPIELHPERGAEIVLGDDVIVEGGTSIEATHSVRIGARTHIGVFCKIMDSNLHSLDNLYERPEAKALVVEEDVRLGDHVILTAGARVGKGAVVEPRTVLGRLVEPGVVVRGNPARVRARGGMDGP